jgi:hypothetical protein
MEKGMKRTTTTQADRTRVGGGNIGGAPFSAISEADPAYAGKVWGVMDEGTAARLKNLTDPETAWTTMLGSASQLKTNPIVFDKLKRQFIDAMKQGKLSPELEAKINHNLALTFGEGAQIRDPSIWKQADTFEKRGALADLMMGQGITPKKGGVALGGEKSGKGVIFKPTDTLIRETEPSLLHTEYGGNTPTFAAGPRLFKLEKESVYRPDLHPGFPTLLTGKDLEVNMIPTPTEVYLPEWHKQFKKKNPDRKPGYYDLALGVKGEGLPSQELNDEYIRHLLREGFKKGGRVDQPSLEERLTKAIANDMAKGGEVESLESRLTKAIAQHNGMAEGGGAFKKIQFMDKGGKVGKVAKGLANVGKRLMADDVLPAAEREANKAKMLDKSVAKKRLYHGTPFIDEAISEFEVRGGGDFGPGIYMTTRPKTANMYASGVSGTRNGVVYPVHAQIKNPLKVKDKYEMNDVFDSVGLGKPIHETLRDLGYDGIHVTNPNPKNLKEEYFVAFEPTQVKSAIGNRGTYDTTDPDITKAEGGSVFKKLQFMADGGVPHMAKGGKLAALGKIGKRLLADPEATTPVIKGGTRKFGDDAGGLNIVRETAGNWSPSGDSVYKANLERQLEKLEKGKYDYPSNYIKTMIEDAVKKGDTRQVEVLTADLRNAIGKEAANKWVQSNLRNYITKQMATRDDPIRKLAEEGITAFPKNIDEYGDMELRTYGSAQAKQNRKATGNEPQGVAKSPLAKHYETMTDESITPTEAEHFQRIQALPKMQRPVGLTADMPWVNKLDPETPLFSLSQDADFDKLGFTHMMDVLREDVAAGRIRPEQLSKISIEQAVRRTHEYDETLKANMLNARIAEQANANVFKEYPEGYKWVQLDKPGQFNLESDVMGHSVRGYEPPKGHPDYSDISGNAGYEGYGHGGYEAIKSGRAKIYSLRDPKGQSHVTVEVRAPDIEESLKSISPNERYQIGKEITEKYFNGRVPAERQAEYQDLFDKAFIEKYGKPKPIITQIKGKQNAAPNKEYLPFVQDFVKSGEYSEVGDLGNTGLVNVSGRYFTEPELTEAAKKYGRMGVMDTPWEVAKQRHLAAGIPEEEALRNWVEGFKEGRGRLDIPPEGMAEGGGAFKKIQFMDKGGITTSGGTFTPEELGVNPSDLVADEKLSRKIKRGLAREMDIGKEQLEKEYRQLGSKGGKRDAAIRIGSQIAGGGVDIANLGLEGLDFLQSLVPALSKPESVLDTAGIGDRVPKFKLAFDDPALGTDNLIRKFKEAKLLGENEFPLTELAANLVVPTAAVSALRKSRQAYKAAKDSINTPKKRQGGLTAMAR